MTARNELQVEIFFYMDWIATNIHFAEKFKMCDHTH